MILRFYGFKLSRMDICEVLSAGTVWMMEERALHVHLADACRNNGRLLTGTLRPSIRLNSHLLQYKPMALKLPTTLLHSEGEIGGKFPAG